MPTPFDDLTDIFDALIDWPKRLANEGPFFRRLFDAEGVRRVVDVASGTGRHAALFHSWGLHVQGADLSPSMVEHAVAAFGTPPGLSFVVRGFDQFIPETFDAAICTGNSLALSPDLPTVERALACMVAALRPGGLLIVHLLNLQAIPEGPCLWQKAIRTTLPEGPALITRGIHRTPAAAHIELLVHLLESDVPGPVPLGSTAIRLLPLAAADLTGALARLGIHTTHLYGNYQNAPYSPSTSQDLLLVAKK